jgi:hypothetical protein
MIGQANHDGARVSATALTRTCAASACEGASVSDQTLTAGSLSRGHSLAMPGLIWTSGGPGGRLWGPASHVCHARIFSVAQPLMHTSP